MTPLFAEGGFFSEFGTRLFGIRSMMGRFGPAAIRITRLNPMDIEGLPLLGEGGCHSVYRTEDGVMKVPKLAWRIVCDHQTVTEDVRLAEAYF